MTTQHAQAHIIEAGFERKLSYISDTDDDDSGLVADAYDVLPEDDLTLDFDESFLLDISNENLSKYSNTKDIQKFKHRKHSLDEGNVDDYFEFETIESETTCSTDVSDIICTDTTQLKMGSDLEGNDLVGSCCTRITLPPIQQHTAQVDLSPQSQPCKGESAKVKAFSKEQAREWRRKRILTSQNKSQVKTERKPANLEPLLPLPGKLKPLTTRGKSVKNLDKASQKLLDPLLGGEKIRTTRGPQPMKLRALPESFWKEPQSVHTSSLARSNYMVLPPLFSAEGNHNTAEVMNVRPVTPPDERSRSPRNSPRRKKKSVMNGQPDTELLFSLFDHLENRVDQRLIIRRGRPKKTYIERIPPPPTRRSCEDNDPCIVDDLTNKLFPELSLKNKQDKSIAIVRLNKGRRSIEFPALEKEKNYPEMLKELITHM